MAKAAFFIDGFNLYHAIDHSFNHHNYKWLNLRSLSEKFLNSGDELGQVCYFTAYCTWDRDKLLRHKKYVKALSSKGVDIVLGRFQRVTKSFNRVKMEVSNVVPVGAQLPDSFTFETHEEKKTDVNVAVKLIELASRGIYDVFYIISADSDFVPALQYIRKFHRNIRLINITPINSSGRTLSQVCDEQIQMSEVHLSGSLLEDEIQIGHELVQIPEKYKVDPVEQLDAQSLHIIRHGV